MRATLVQPWDIHVTDIPTGQDFFSDRARRPCGRLALVARLRLAAGTERPR